MAPCGVRLAVVFAAILLHSVASSGARAAAPGPVKQQVDAYGASESDDLAPYTAELQQPRPQQAAVGSRTSCLEDLVAALLAVEVGCKQDAEQPSTAAVACVGGEATTGGCAPACAAAVDRAAAQLDGAWRGDERCGSAAAELVRELMANAGAEVDPSRGARRLQDLCSLDEVMASAAEINAACGDGTSCSPMCAALLLPFAARCQQFIAANADMASAMAGPVAVCLHTPPFTTPESAILPVGVLGSTSVLCYHAPQGYEPPRCEEYAPDTLGVSVQAGTCGAGDLGRTCVLVCEEGFVPDAIESGLCIMTPDGSSARYRGQHATCTAEILGDGQYSPGYCSAEAPEVIVTRCCEGLEQQACDPQTNLPQECTVECADAWLPLWQSCLNTLAPFNELYEMCSETAEEFLSGAPSSIEISGSGCHPQVTGTFVLDTQTVSAKQAWSRGRGTADIVHLYWSAGMSSATGLTEDKWCLGFDLESCFASFESSEELPPWETNRWTEVCEQQARATQLNLDPSFTSKDCEQALKLVTTEVHEQCCREQTDCVDGSPPQQCGVDCAKVWFPFSKNCGFYLRDNFGDQYDQFSAQCNQTHTDMHVLSVRGAVSEGGPPWNVTFTARSNHEYQVEMRPSDSLLLSAMRMIAPHSHHVMASRSDASSQSSGRKVLRWAATNDEVGVDVSVEALSGSGEFDLDITIQSTIEALALEAITMPQHCATTPEAADCARAGQYTILMNCDGDASCTYNYGGVEAGSGNSFLLRIHGEAGLTYDFTTELMRTQPAGTHIKLAIFHEDAIGTSRSSEESLHLEDADFGLGQWTSQRNGSPTYAELKGCDLANPDAVTRIPCGGQDEEIGEFRTFPEGAFDDTHTVEWPCPATGTYFVQVTANCDVPFFADTSRCSLEADQTWNCLNRERDFECLSEVRLQIDVADRSTTVTHQTVVAVSREALTPGSESEALVASMFTGAQHPAIAYVTEITPIGLGACSQHPCLHGGDCTDMAPTDVDGSYARVYTCDCPPSWLGVNCEESAEEALEESTLFRIANQGAAPTGGGHRRTQGLGEPEPEPEPMHALITLSARGQTATLAQRHIETMLARAADPDDGSIAGRRRLGEDMSDDECPCNSGNSGHEIAALRQQNKELQSELADWRAGRVQRDAAPGISATVKASPPRRNLQGMVGDACSGGATITTTPGTIDFTQGYDNHAACSWLIRCNYGGRPQLQLTSFDIEQGFDFVAIHDGSEEQDQEILRASGSMGSLPTTQFQASGSAMLLYFTSDGSVIGTGFSATYSGCVTQTAGPPPPPPPPPDVAPVDQLNEFWAPAFQWRGAGSDAKHILMCPDNQCSHRPCINHGVCSDIFIDLPGGVRTGFSCSCPAGFTGPICETPPSCDTPLQFYTMVAPVTTTCCLPDNANCDASGIPTSACTAECAAVLEPLFTACEGSFLSAPSQVGVKTMLATAIASCPASSGR